MVENDLAQQAVDHHHRDLAGNLHAAVVDVDVFAGLELVELLAAGDVLRVLLEAVLGILRRRDVNFVGRINAFGAAAGFDVRAEFGERHVQDVIGTRSDNGILTSALFGPSGMPRTYFKNSLKNGGSFCWLRIVLGAEVIQIGSVGERILRDEINIAPVKFLILPPAGSGAE